MLLLFITAFVRLDIDIVWAITANAAPTGLVENVVLLLYDLFVFIFIFNPEIDMIVCFNAFHISCTKNFEGRPALIGRTTNHRRFNNFIILWDDISFK